MFFENQRIVNKQLKYTKLRAYEIIQDLESKGLGEPEIMSCINLLMKGEISEFQQDVLEFALKTVTSRQEKSDAFQVIDSSYSFIHGRVERKVKPDRQHVKTNKRKAQRRNKNRKDK